MIELGFPAAGSKLHQFLIVTVLNSFIKALGLAGVGAFDGPETDLPPPPNILVCGRSEMQIFTFYENSLIFPIKLNAFSSGGCKQWTVRTFILRG